MTSASQILESFWNIWSQVSQRKKPFSDFPARGPVVPKSYRPKGQPRSTTNEFPIRADFGNSRQHPIWLLKRGGKLTADGAVLSPEKRDFTVLLTKFAFIVTFEEFLVLYSEQSFHKCLINKCLVPLAGITEENSTVQRDILNYGNIC